MNSKETLIKTAVVVCISVLLALSGFILIKGCLGGHFSSMENFRLYISSFGICAPLALLLIQLFLTVLPVCTSFTGCVVGAALFGAVGGFWTNYIGISLGSILAYALARKYGVGMVNKMLPMHKYDAYTERINRSKSYSRLLFLAILLPMAPDNFLCYFSGLVDMQAKTFITIILTAKPWCILFYSIFFSYFI